MTARLVGLLVLLVLACSAHAQNIELLNQRYMTDLSFRISSVEPPNYIDRFTSSSETSFKQSTSPLDSTLQSSSPRVFAQAKASTFAVSTNTSALWKIENNEVSAFARADAESRLSFRALHDVATPLHFSIVGSGVFFSDGFFSLYDRTADEHVFAHSWSSHAGRIPKYAPPPGSTPVALEGSYQASILLNPFLSSSHIYDLVLHASTDANTDSQRVSLDVAGLYPVAAPVPEPSEVALTIAGLLGVGALVRLSRTRANRPGHAVSALAAPYASCSLLRDEAQTT